jgi:hypothetical protein
MATKEEPQASKVDKKSKKEDKKSKKEEKGDAPKAEAPKVSIDLNTVNRVHVDGNSSESLKAALAVAFLDLDVFFTKDNAGIFETIRCQCISNEFLSDIDNSVFQYPAVKLIGSTQTIFGGNNVVRYLFASKNQYTPSAAVEDLLNYEEYTLQPLVAAGILLLLIMTKEVRFIMMINTPSYHDGLRK